MKSAQKLLVFTRRNPIGTVAYDIEKKTDYALYGQMLVKDILTELQEHTTLIDQKFWYNKGGIAVSGDHNVMALFDTGKGFHLFFNHDSNLGICYRTISSMQDYTGGRNRWMSMEQLAEPNVIINNLLKLRDENG